MSCRGPPTAASTAARTAASDASATVADAPTGTVPGPCSRAVGTWPFSRTAAAFAAFIVASISVNRAVAAAPCTGSRTVPSVSASTAARTAWPTDGPAVSCTAR
ncbi:hypothetical protein ACFQYP_41530 [Nonomuraea antimicrobica]